MKIGIEIDWILGIARIWIRFGDRDLNCGLGIKFGNCDWDWRLGLGFEIRDWDQTLELAIGNNDLE